MKIIHSNTKYFKFTTTKHCDFYIDLLSWYLLPLVIIDIENTLVIDNWLTISLRFLCFGVSFNFKRSLKRYHKLREQNENNN